MRAYQEGTGILIYVSAREGEVDLSTVAFRSAEVLLFGEPTD